MFWIKSLLFFIVAITLTTGCSHRHKRSPYFAKHSKDKKNYFNPNKADKSKKVRLDDEDEPVGEEPEATSNGLSTGAKKHPTMKSYSINGVTYYPSTVEVGEIISGIASWYGPDFNGKKTSNGEYYDMYDFTAAHKTFPMHTIVRVTNIENGKEVTVRVNDRGPFVKGRIIDLSKAAARAIEMTKKGTAKVKLKVLGFNDGTEKMPLPSFNVEAEKKVSTSDTSIPITKERRYKEGDVYVQIGSFSLEKGAKTYQERFELLGEQYQVVIKKKIVKGREVYKVLIAGFKSDAEARNYIALHDGFENAFIIRD